MEGRRNDEAHAWVVKRGPADSGPTAAAEWITDAEIVAATNRCPTNVISLRTREKALRVFAKAPGREEAHGGE